MKSTLPPSFSQTARETSTVRTRLTTRFLRSAGMLAATLWITTCFLAGASLAYAMSSNANGSLVAGAVTMLLPLFVSAELMAEDAAAVVSLAFTGKDGAR